MSLLSFSSNFYLLLLLLTTITIITIQPTLSRWPNAPFYDTCNGLPQSQCIKQSFCSWFETSAPWCYDTLFQTKMPPKGVHPPSDFVKKFFIFSFGSHLSEGSNNQVHYNLNVTECAIQCLRAASATADSTSPTRCLSFDFYPFEDPIRDSPYFERPEAGVCILNTANKDTARLRNEDQGLTDAELFYRLSHYTKRPFSNSDGYYEIRDPRGGEVAKMLDYLGSSLDFAPSIVWGGSRWGISHLSLPTPIDTTYSCDGPRVVQTSSDNGGGPTPPANPVFFGGYTPVDQDQHCAGKMSKNDAQALCQSTGGYLCATQDVLNQLEGHKLGCSLDGYPIWSAADAPNQANKFVRCCATYGVVDSCSKFLAPNIKKCKSYKTFSDCINKGSGTAKQVQFGFGHLLTAFREVCRTQGVCKGMMMDWHPRDDCVWCLKPGTGKGECLPGADYGICETSEPEAKALFALTVKAKCGPPAICLLTNSYPWLGTSLSVPTSSPTFSPTLSPVPPTPPSSAPTKFICLNAHKGGPSPKVAQQICAQYSWCVWKNGKCVQLGG
jgi:hypothetical protein